MKNLRQILTTTKKEITGETIVSETINENDVELITKKLFTKEGKIKKLTSETKKCGVTLHTREQETNTLDSKTKELLIKNNDYTKRLVGTIRDEQVQITDYVNHDNNTLEIKVVKLDDKNNLRLMYYPDGTISGVSLYVEDDCKQDFSLKATDILSESEKPTINIDLNKEKEEIGVLYEADSLNVRKYNTDDIENLGKLLMTSTLYDYEGSSNVKDYEVEYDYNIDYNEEGKPIIKGYNISRPGATNPIKIVECLEVDKGLAEGETGTLIIECMDVAEGETDTDILE